MANFREHITVSGMLGLGYGLGSVVAFEFNPLQGLLAACFTGVSGMLPDLDSDNGRPVREMFGLLGAVAPLLLVNRVTAFFGLPGDPETVMLVVIALYLAIKYGGATLVSRLSVHRGMFHSLPALIIAAEAVYLAYPGPRASVKLLMAGGVAVGFLSHLLLDELYSVEMKGSRLRLKQSSGTALKWSGNEFFPNVFAFTLMATLSYAVLLEEGWFDQGGASSTNQPRLAAPPDSSGAESPPHLETSTDLGAPADMRTAVRPNGVPPVEQSAFLPANDPWPARAAELFPTVTQPGPEAGSISR